MKKHGKTDSKDIKKYTFFRTPVGNSNETNVLFDNDDDTVFVAYKSELIIDGYSYYFYNRLEDRRTLHTVSHRTLNSDSTYSFLFDGININDYLENAGISILKTAHKSNYLDFEIFKNSERTTVAKMYFNKGHSKYFKIKTTEQNTELLFIIFFYLSKSLS